MKARLRFYGWTVLMWAALVAAAKAVKYITADGSMFAPEFRDKYLSMLPVVWTHGSAAIIALAIGPWLFPAWLRQRSPRAHRIAGRVYLLAVLVAGSAGFVMALRAYGGLPAQAAFCLLDVLWLATGTMALRAARARRIPEHREWMMRNYALTFAAVTLRLYLQTLFRLGFDYPEIYVPVAWAAWVPNLLAVEAWLAWRSRRKYFRWSTSPDVR